MQVIFQECLHNTVGERCELCAPGYYGDATKGTPDDCKPCECPHPIGKNPFIPECEADPLTGGFKCICPRGYEGPRCERLVDSQTHIHLYIFNSKSIFSLILLVVICFFL